MIRHISVCYGRTLYIFNNNKSTHSYDIIILFIKIFILISKLLFLRNQMCYMINISVTGCEKVSNNFQVLFNFIGVFFVFCFIGNRTVLNLSFSVQPFFQSNHPIFLKI